MWIVVTAVIDASTIRKMRVNFDNVVSYGPAASYPCMIMGVDGQAYPVKETPEELDVLVEPHTPKPKPRKK